jgi:hypothetical protein
MMSFCYEKEHILIDLVIIWYFSDMKHRYMHSKAAIPLQVLTGPEGSGRLRVPGFKIIGT